MDVGPQKEVPASVTVERFWMKKIGWFKPLIVVLLTC